MLVNSWVSAVGLHSFLLCKVGQPMSLGHWPTLICSVTGWSTPPLIHRPTTPMWQIHTVNQRWNMPACQFNTKMTDSVQVRACWASHRTVGIYFKLSRADSTTSADSTAALCNLHRWKKMSIRYPTTFPDFIIIYLFVFTPLFWVYLPFSTKQALSSSKYSQLIWPFFRGKGTPIPSCLPIFTTLSLPWAWLGSSWGAQAERKFRI